MQIYSKVYNQSTIFLDFYDRGDIRPCWDFLPLEAFLLFFASAANGSWLGILYLCYLCVNHSGRLDVAGRRRVA
ncbi:MAG: hypothetical protein C4530_10630 [Desulfobacteraceae bacterium]|nr:MAG: hypothetical protein C4530_10630 [Desulfobacteraceae bacterium]